VREGDVEGFLEGITELEVTLEQKCCFIALVFTFNGTSFLGAFVVANWDDAEKEFWDATTLGAVCNICETWVSDKSDVVVKVGPGLCSCRQDTHNCSL
jgi:hypothetical protein